MLARLGVFAGGCSLEVADAVCADDEPIGSALDTIASLVDKSLVRQWDGGDGEPRFGLLESIREYALERLAEAASSSGCGGATPSATSRSSRRRSPS